MKSSKISVVIPVFRSSNILESLYGRLQPVLDSISDDWEVLLVDDASNDGTFGVMLSLRNLDPRIKIIRFARNMGQHHATLCGIQRSCGDIVITLDDDLQNPPEEMPKLLAKLDEGYDLVIGRIATTKKHSWARNFFSGVIQQLLCRILHKPKDLVLTSYRCMTRRAADGIAAFTGAHPYLPALMLAAVPADRIANVLVSHEERARGRSTYTVAKLVELASYLLINHSYIPLRFVTAWGMALSLLSFLFAIWVVLRVVFFGSPLAGWPSLAVLTAFLCGNVLFCVGILGEYVGRLVEENSRPRQFPVFEEHL